ncbi:MAG: DUF4179 domain-containing protein [Turicibacter sp.]|uniref:DUF4179 domain-containing protein n=1 Tax=Turicibacter faecis TaxID=2963365 RepID=A0ABM8IRG0_9FIRM|nr:DUF4179 domain-containing protein [Turicibacter sp.]BEH92031.1 hypothetical protein T23_21330 [Turicibacter sp. TC023]
MNSKMYEEAVIKGIERANQEMKKNKGGIKSKKVVPIVASLCLVGGVGLNQPPIINALKEIGESFNEFSGYLFGGTTEKFQKVATEIGESMTDKDLVITVEEVVLDDNLLLMALTVESEFLKGYEGLNENDFFNLDYRLRVNHRIPEAMNAFRVRKIDEKTGAIIIEADLSTINLKDEVMIELGVNRIARGYNFIEGKWDFKFKVAKLEGTEEFHPNVKTAYEDTSISLNRLMKSSLATTFELEVKGQTVNEVRYQLDQLVVRGSNGYIYEPTFISENFDEKSKEYSGRLRVDSDMDGLEWLELYPREEIARHVQVDGWTYEIYQTPNKPIFSDEYEKVTRLPNEQELAAGYGLDDVTYYINGQLPTEFKPLTEYISDEVWVNSTEKVTIENVELQNDEVVVTVKIPSTYSERNLARLVLFDETMNDYAAREGQLIVAPKDESQGIYQIKLDAIDTNKMYTIALPLMPETNEEVAPWCLRVPLK